MIAGSLEIQMWASMARIEADMTSAKRIVGGAMGEIEKMAGMAKSALGAIGVGLSAEAFISWVGGAIEAADSMNDLSKSTGIAIDQLAGLKLAAQQSGADLEGTAQAINKLSVKMGENADKYAKIGVTAKDPLEAFKQLADVFNKIDDPQKRAAFGAEALGKNWAAAAPLLAEGSAGIQEMVDKGILLSGMTQDAASQADAFNDRVAEVKASLGGMSLLIANDSLPILTDLATVLRESSQEARAAAVSAKILGDDASVMNWADKSAMAVAYLIDTLSAFSKVVTIVADLQAAQLASATTFADWLTTPVSGSGKAAITGAWDSLKGQMGAIWGGFADDANAAAMSYESFATKLQATIDKRAGNAKSVEDTTKAIARQTEAEKAGIAAFIAGEKEKKAAKSPLDTAFDSFSAEAAKREAILTAEAGGVAKLTDAEKWALEVMVKVRDGKLGQSDAERRLIGERVEAVSILEKLNAQEKLNEAAIGRHVDAIAADQTRAQSIIDANTALRQQSAELGLSSDALVALKQSRIDEQIALENWRLGLIGGTEAEGSQATAIRETIAALQDSKAALAENASAQKAADAIKAQGDLWKSVESTAQQTFSGIFESGADSFERLRTALKNGLYDLLYQMTMKKWIIHIAAGVSGTAAAESAFGKASSLGFDSLIGTAATTGYEATSDTFFSSAGSGLLGMLPSFAVGTDYVPEDMVAQIHKGEKITPAAYNKDGSDTPISLSMPVTIDASGADSGVEQRLAGAVTQLQSWVIKTVPGVVRAAQLRNRQSPTV